MRFVQNMEKITIAIDGYSSCGKSTIAKALANKLGYTYIDTGAMYRAITLYCVENEIIRGNDLDIEKLKNALTEINISFQFNSDTNCSEIILNGKNVEDRIRMMDIADNVSKVSSVKEVRQKLVALQRKIGENGGIVMDGRDIGTIVFPNADLKIFMTAAHNIRVRRRFDEMKSKGIEASFEEISENIRNRDYEDTHREESPLTQASDAIVLDNSNLNRQQQLQFALKILKEKFDF